MCDAMPAMPEGDYSGASYRDARQGSPIQKGDVVFVLDGDAVKRALIIHVMAEYLDRRGYYIPSYRVRLETKDGRWANAWRQFYPGHIERAYEKIATHAR